MKKCPYCTAKKTMRRYRERACIERCDFCTRYEKILQKIGMMEVEYLLKNYHQEELEEMSNES